jgi:hypothetical protein
MLIPLLDDPAIPDDTFVYRRVGWDHVGGQARFAIGQTASLSANAFRDYPMSKAEELGFAGPCMSVGLGHVIAEAGVSPAEAMLSGYTGYGLSACLVGTLRSLTRLDGTGCVQGLLCAPTESEPWHGVVFDVTGVRKEAVSKAIVRASTWVVPLVRSE